MNFDKNTQTILVSSRAKGQHIIYEVQKDGIIELRKFKNKKLRVVFNIFPLTNHLKSTATLFNQNLFSSENTQHQQPKLIEQSPLTQQQVNTKIQQQKTKIQPTQKTSYLTICHRTKQLSENRLIITLNAYLNQQQPPKLIILGYLISSLVLYHNWTSEFSQQSALTRLLSSLGKLLANTHIDKLNEDIKFKTGYDKTPYFLCLIGKLCKSNENISQVIKSKQSLKNDQYHNQKQYNQSNNYLNEFYRFQSQKQNSTINSALQTLIDYFPQRSSIDIQLQHNKQQYQLTQNSLSQITQLGIQFEQKIVGRQLFSFEFTSTTVENLLFQLCQCFNAQQDINLTYIYNKVIMNKKSRIQTEMIELYLGMVQKNIFLNSKIDLYDNFADFSQESSCNSILPISDHQLQSILNSIRQVIVQETQLQAMNCMNLEQYLQAKTKVLGRIYKYQQKITQLNLQLGNKFLNQCYSIVNVNHDDLKIDWNQPHSLSTVKEVFTLLTNKLSSFSNQCLGLFTHSDSNATKYNSTFLQLITKYFKNIQHIFLQSIEQSHVSKRNSQLQIETLNYQLKKSIAQRLAIEKQYQLQLLMEEQLKTKLKEHILEESSYSSFSSQSTILKKGDSLTYLKKAQSSTFNNSKQFYRMKKLIQQLQEQVKDKNNQIQQLTEILQKFQSTQKLTNSLTFYEKKNDKFNQQTQKLIAEANSKILKFYQILQEVKNIQKNYETTKKSLLKERQKIIDEKRQNLKQITIVKGNNEQVKLQNQKLTQIINQEKKALQQFTQLKDSLKSNISLLQAQNAQTTCALAQVQGQLEFYRKALTLVVEQYMKGKSQNLIKFYKFLEHPKLKQLLKPLIKH